MKKYYDFIFIDCPPSLGQTVTAASLAADYIVVPVDPERFSLSGLNVTLNELEKVAKKFETSFNIKIVLNKFDARTSLSHQVLAALFSDKNYQQRLFKTFIRTCQELPNSISKGKTLFDSLRSSTGKEDTDLLAREFIEFTRIQETDIESEKIQPSNIYSESHIKEDTLITELDTTNG